MSKTKNFSIRRVIAVTWRVLTQISRDRRTIALIIFIPALIMLIFGFVLGGQAKNLPILVDNQDTGYTIHTPGLNSTTINFGNETLTQLQADDRVNPTEGNFNSGKTGVDNGTYYAAITLPANFSEIIALKNTGQSSNASITIYLDGTNPTIQATIMAALQSSLQNTLGSGVVLNEQYAFGGIEFSSLDVSIPAVISLVLTQTVLLISLIIIVRETTAGVLSRLYTMPLSGLERLLGYSIALLILGMAMTGVVLFIGLGIFGAIIQGSLALLFLGAVLYALLNIFLAVLLSNFAKNELQAVQMVPLITLASMALSGLLIPVESFPAWVQDIAKLVPMYYANKMFEGIMLKGYGISNLAPEFIFIGGITLLFFVVAVITVKDRMPD